MATTTKTRHATAAAQIRARLKSAFPGVVFAVRSKGYSGGSNVNIEWTDGPTERQVDHIAGLHEYGHFDGMTDCYVHDNDKPEAFVCPDGSLEPVARVSYAHTTRRISPETLWCVARAFAQRRGVRSQLPDEMPRADAMYGVLDAVRTVEHGHGFDTLYYDAHGIVKHCDLTGRKAIGIIRAEEGEESHWGCKVLTVPA